MLINGPYDYSGAFLNVATYRQMIGRAGRAGIDTLGEAVLFCKEKDYTKALKYLVGSKLPPIKSCLVKEEPPVICSSQTSQSSFVSASQVSEMSLSQVSSAVRQLLTQSNSNCLKRAILEVVSNGTASSQADVEDYIKSTFCSVSSQLANEKKEDWQLTPNLFAGSAAFTNISQMDNIRKAIDEAALALKEDKLIFDGEDKENESSGKELSVSTLGKAIVASGIGPEEGQFIQRELNRARVNIRLENDLHIVYLVSTMTCA